MANVTSDGVNQGLIEYGQIKAELHAHTVATDGELSIDALIEHAKDRGMHTLAVTDHSQSSREADGLSPQRLREHLAAIREAAQRIGDISVLAGAEVDILEDGSLDYDDGLLAELDIVVASVHHVLEQSPEMATQRLVKAVRHPSVHVLGHPTARAINTVRGLNPDMTAVIEAAVESNTALEINCNPSRLDLRESHIRAAIQAGALLAINCDVHRASQFDRLDEGVKHARKGGMTTAKCINAWPHDDLHQWLRSKRP